MSWRQAQRKAWAADWGDVYDSAKQLLGFLARVSVYAALFGALYMFGQRLNIFTKPLASLTLGEILHTAGFHYVGGAARERPL
jgi:hypothetical protein